MTLAPLDYVMIGVLLVVVTIVLVMRPCMKSVADFLAANRCAGLNPHRQLSDQGGRI